MDWPPHLVIRQAERPFPAAPHRVEFRPLVGGVMDIRLRPGTLEDAEVCGPICFEAFGAIAGKHGFPLDVPSREVSTGLLSMLLGRPGIYSVVAAVNGEVVGSNFLDEHSIIAAVAPI